MALGNEYDLDKKRTEDDKYPDELVQLLGWMNIFLLFTTIALLLMLYSAYSAPRETESGEAPHKYDKICDGEVTTTKTPTTPETRKTRKPYKKPVYKLICVFEYLRSNYRAAPQCTHYVYIRLFTYSYFTEIYHEKSLVFETKRAWDPKDGPIRHRLYYDLSNELWRRYSYFHIDGLVKYAMAFWNQSDWFLGMWGATYTRLVAGYWPAEMVREALSKTLRSNFSTRGLTMSNFKGFAIINTILRDYMGLENANNYSHLFRGKGSVPPILETKWVFMHTLAAWPHRENDPYFNEYVQLMLREADKAGLSTSNSTDEPNLVWRRSFRSIRPYKAASPPNPLNPAAPGTRGMLDILDEFPKWEKKLNRTGLCFSVTSAINYARNNVPSIDFVREIVDMNYVQRYSRLRFIRENHTSGKYPVEEEETSYFFDNATRTHYWKHFSSRNELHRFFAYDTGDTLNYKVKEMLTRYNGRCVVFDDVGDDFESAHITVGNQTIAFIGYELLKSVHQALEDTFPGE